MSTELVIKYRNASGRERDRICTQLLADYSNLIISIIKDRVPGIKGDITETIEYSVGLTGFLEALKKFDTSLKLEFSTFLTHNVGIHMTRHLAGYYYGVHCFAQDIEDNDSPDGYSEVDAVNNCRDIQVTEPGTPAYIRLDTEDDIDEGLSKYPAPVIFGIKVLSGFSGYGRVGRLQLYKLIGAEHKATLIAALDSLGIQ
ncbi:MAG: hypothetical protein WC279_13240 [Sulfurimonas sp.]|jgi:hypothetical protein|uniref:hypothetical protein n=1 Tax=Sulfurimonas sp. TaxID=2022749 RepID=UPI0035645354